VLKYDLVGLNPDNDLTKAGLALQLFEINSGSFSLQEERYTIKIEKIKSLEVI
jgi:hypothetical protein